MPGMLSVKELTEQRGELIDRAEAIAALAVEETRELTDQEIDEIDGILGSGSPGDDNHRPGKIHKIDAAIARARRLEEIQAGQARQRNGGIQLQAGNRMAIPATARKRYSGLRAFKGENAEYDAYCSGQWMRAVFFRHEQASRWCRDHGINVQSALEGGDNSAGGYLVPDEMENAIIDLREMRGVLRQFARSVPMASDTKTMPRRSGGLTGYWLDENSSITESEKTWDNVTLVAKKLGALVKYSSELSEDSIISIADDLTSEIAYTFATNEDQAGFLGDGTSTYGGISGLITAVAAGSTVTAATGNTAFSTLDLDDFESMVGKLPMYPGIDPAWYLHKAGWAASMLRLQAAAGGNTIATLGAGPTQQQFLGYPVRFVQVMNSTLTAQTSTNGLAYFGDLRMAVTLGTRRGVRIMVSADRYFELDQLAIKGTERLDIKAHETGTASAAGAVIMLATPGS